MFTRASDTREVHVIAFDIPVPVNYGGAIDIYFKLLAFKSAGVKVHLHCYQYGREKSPELEAICETVHYYQRDISKTNLFSRLPYIVVTRASQEMLMNILADRHPILFEGLHTTYFLDERRLRKRRKIVRTHNIEHQYYTGLGKVEKNIFKRYYFFNEASKLKRYEEVLQHANGIAAISRNDQEYFSQQFRNVAVVTAFHPMEEVDILSGTGEYALYHASLEVGENNQAALFLAGEVFRGLDIPLVIAGNKPSGELRELVKSIPNVSLRINIAVEEINNLVRNAQINILPTFQATGIKLKLLLALYSGRHCIVNTPMIEKTGLEQLCIVKDSADEMVAAVREYFGKPFTEECINSRRRVLDDNGFSNRHNIGELIKMLFH